MTVVVKGRKNKDLEVILHEEKKKVRRAFATTVRLGLSILSLHFFTSNKFLSPRILFSKLKSSQAPKPMYYKVLNSLKGPKLLFQLRQELKVSLYPSVWDKSLTLLISGSYLQVDFKWLHNDFSPS